MSSILTSSMLSRKAESIRDTEKHNNMLINRWQRKDLRRRLRVDHHWVQRRQRKAQIRDGLGDPSRGEEVKRLQQARSLRNRDGSPTRVHNRCVETGRGRSVMRRFRRSRFVIRERGLQGRLPGVKKASW